MSTSTLDLERFEEQSLKAKRTASQHSKLRELLDRWDWLAGFPVTFFPVLYSDLRRRGIWSDKLEARALTRVAHRLGAFPGAGEFLPGVITDEDGYLHMEEALLAGLRPGDFHAWDRDGDGRIHYLRELLPQVAVRLLREGLIDREQYARILAARD